MKHILLISVFAIFYSNMYAQNTMVIHFSNSTEEFEISESDSLYFSEDNNVVYFNIGQDVLEYYVEDIDSITFEANTGNTVDIYYNGNNVTITNPLESSGVEIDVDGADVVVSSTAGVDDINYRISGTSNDGMFKVYSDSPFNVLMNGINLTNTDGPPINFQSSDATIELVAGTSNIITDGEEYSDSEEDQSGTLFSEADLIFIGSGSLLVNGNGSDQHGIRSDDIIYIYEGNITIASSQKDGIHGKDGFYIYGGSVNINPSGDGIDGSNGNVEVENGTITINSLEDNIKGIKCDGSIKVCGGSIGVSVEGDQSKGLKCDGDMFLEGGTINIEASGGVVLEESEAGYDPSYCTAIKGESDIYVSGGSINLITTGEASRGFSGDGNMYIDGGEIEIVSSGNGDTYVNEEGEDDAYHGACFSVDENFEFNGGSIIVSNSGSGGKGVSVDGNITIGNGSNNPFLQVTTTGSSITITPGGGGNEGDYDESKAVKSDSIFVFNSGEMLISSADDGVKADYAITINNGTLTINDSFEGLEAPEIEINDGDISIIASDDAINATYGNGGEANDGSFMKLNGGYIYLSASGGDALDSNGDIFINGGTIVVHGPQQAPEVGMDYNGDCIVTCGFLVLSGTDSNMTQNASYGSTQTTVLFRTNSQISANTIFHIEDGDGNNLLTFAPCRNYSSIVFSSPDLETGVSYSIYKGGTSTGTEENGLYTDGEYSGGNYQTEFTLNSTVSTVWF